MEPIPQHWISVADRVQSPQGRSYQLTVWGWSTSSISQAAQTATRRLGELGQRVRAGERLFRRGAYYPRMPLREEVLQEFHRADGTLIAAITRNRYGAEVLNTDALLIADVDVPRVRWSGLRTWILAKVFAGEKDGGAGPSEGAAVERIQEFARTNPALGVHIYQTKAGFRVLITGARVLPGSAEAERILQALASDPIYATLCATHKTYRARLTPKPWRIGMPALALRWPWQTEVQARQAKDWIEEYRRRGAPYAVCQRVRLGPAVRDPDQSRVLEAHDRAVLGHPDQRLA